LIDNNLSIELQEWLRTHKIIQKGVEGFWECYTNYSESSPKNFFRDFGNVKKDEIEIEYNSISYSINYKLTKPEVLVDFKVIIKKDDKIKNIFYVQVYNTKGEIMDDIFYMLHKDWE